MELDKAVTSVFAQLCSSLSKDDVHFMDYLLQVNFDHHWPRMEPLSATAVMIKMKELGLWKVDRRRKKCHLSYLIHLLHEIGRQDLSALVKDFGWLICQLLTVLLHLFVNLL